VSLLGLQVPAPIGEPLAAIGIPTGILMAVAVGIRFEPRVRVWPRRRSFTPGDSSRAVAVAIAIVLIFALTDVDRTVLLRLAVAPTPFFIVAFATMENLDVRLTVNTLSRHDHEPSARAGRHLPDSVKTAITCTAGRNSKGVYDA
jgi:predicted permease